MKQQIERNCRAQPPLVTRQPPARKCFDKVFDSSTSLWLLHTKARRNDLGVKTHRVSERLYKVSSAFGLHQIAKLSLPVKGFCRNLELPVYPAENFGHERNKIPSYTMLGSITRLF
uniref:Uncharacterized protein n=1 Tax=Micrurus corallinus TaxID=54390 RepID=A0A2D4GUF3_MICCO